MQAHEPHPGVVVRVSEEHWKSEFGGMVGVVQGVWGHPDYPAVDVRLEDGSLELFWFHELDDAEEVIGHGSAVVK